MYTHTYVYMYIYIYRERERDRGERERKFLATDWKITFASKFGFSYSFESFKCFLMLINFLQKFLGWKII